MSSPNSDTQLSTFPASQAAIGLPYREQIEALQPLEQLFQGVTAPPKHRVVTLRLVPRMDPTELVENWLRTQATSVQGSEQYSGLYKWLSGPREKTLTVDAGATLRTEASWELLSQLTSVLSRMCRSATVADQVTSELARLPPAWAGPGSVSSSKNLIQEVESVLDRLPLNVPMPQIEVEEEDGSVALRWIYSNKMQCFSLVFRGNGRVTGVLATVNPPQSRSWSAPIADEIRIASELEDVKIFD
jgi:hypothetical protein